LSRTYEILCHNCRQRLWIGQGVNTVIRLTTTEAKIARLETFFTDHQEHALEVRQSERLSIGQDDYIDLTDYDT
jgi:hypothetical protein